MKVEPAAFVARMTERWTTELNNVPSPELQAVWSQMADAFNAQIADADNPDADRWRVLQPATGTGKSQGAALFAAMLSDVDHPGVLIVTRLITQADDVAATVNKIAGRAIAHAFHSDSDETGIAALSDFPVLVITHRAYEIGLDAVNNGQHAANWNRFHAWRDGSRKLIVIDEALDIIQEAQIDLGKVTTLRGIIPPDIAEQFPDAMAMLATVEQVLTDIARVAKERNKPEAERVLWKGATKMPERYDLTPLRQALRGARLDRRLLMRSDPKENQRLVSKWDEVLRSVQATVSNWNWYAKKLADHTLNTARLIVPENINGAVILDATASSNLIYELFDKATVLPVPAKARDYRNVRLHVSMGHAVGKVSMVRDAKAEAGKLIANLQSTLGCDRRVFVCCHQGVEPHLASIDTGFAAFDVGHFGAIDGRNTWQDFDAAVIFGLPFRDKAWSANTFMALRGLQDTEWLNADGARPFGKYLDVRKALELGQLVVNVVQAINRVRCRKVIDAQGNCAPVDVFLLLPGGDTGRGILDGIVREMPGLIVEDWTYGDAKGQAKRVNHGEALVRYAQGIGEGRYSATEVRSHLSIPATPWERIAAQLKEPESDLSKRLVKAGARYVVEGNGKRRHGYIVKG